MVTIDLEHSTADLVMAANTLVKRSARERLVEEVAVPVAGRRSRTFMSPSGSISGRLVSTSTNCPELRWRNAERRSGPATIIVGLPPGRDSSRARFLPKRVSASLRSASSSE
jgi:hypothetical protein